MTPRSEAAIAKWLKLPKAERSIGAIDDRGTIILYGEGGAIEVARFTLKSIIAKRLPARKRKGKK